MIIVFYSLSAQPTLHVIRGDSRIIPHERCFRVRGVLADLLVGVTESTTNGLWVTYLSTGLKEVLALEYIFWGKLTEIFLRSHFAGEEGRRETGTLSHTTNRR
jgi:hypothetical protein